MVTEGLNFCPIDSDNESRHDGKKIELKLIIFVAIFRPLRTDNFYIEIQYLQNESFISSKLECIYTNMKVKVVLQREFLQK